jgi:hypothetical protein
MSTPAMVQWMGGTRPALANLNRFQGFVGKVCKSGPNCPGNAGTPFSFRKSLGILGAVCHN